LGVGWDTPLLSSEGLSRTASWENVIPARAGASASPQLGPGSVVVVVVFVVVVVVEVIVVALMVLVALSTVVVVVGPPAAHSARHEPRLALQLALAAADVARTACLHDRRSAGAGAAAQPVFAVVKAALAARTHAFFPALQPAWQ
jgi:hypothetical protein